jgi:excisionase family DNA binding protein
LPSLEGAAARITFYNRSPVSRELARNGDDKWNYPERLLTPRQVAELEGCSLTTVYKRLTDGEYSAIKDGVKTLISSASIARRREALPKAEYGLRKGVFGVPSKTATA